MWLLDNGLNGNRLSSCLSFWKPLYNLFLCAQKYIMGKILLAVSDLLTGLSKKCTIQLITFRIYHESQLCSVVLIDTFFTFYSNIFTHGICFN